MAEYALTPTTFDGTSINDATYTTKFLRAFDPLRLVTREPVEVEVPGDYAFPTSPRSQPQSRILPLLIELSSTTQTVLDNMKKLFDPHKGDVFLVANDGDANAWRLTVRVVDLVGHPQGKQVFTARLYVVRPVFESNAENSDVQTLSATPGTWTVTNAGTVRAYPTFEVKPTVAKANTADYIHRRQVIIAWRSELEGVSTDGLGYPIDVNEGGLDLSAENTAGRLQADGDDLRVLVDGEEVDRWIDTSLVADYVWCNIAFKPKRQLTVKTAMTAGSPADGGDLEVSDPEGTLGWDDAGFVKIDSECIQYKDKDGTNLKDVVRGARNTTAAIHSAGTDIFWVEHDIQLVYNYTAAANPPAAADRQPVIDLANSTNLVHKYPGAVFVAPTTLRSGQLLRRFTNDNLLSPVISLKEEGGGIKFRDTAPAADTPQFNNLELYVPCGIKAAAGAITHDVTVEDILNLEVYGIDLEGYEALLERYDSTNDGAAVTLTPSSVLSRLRYAANLTIVTGVDVQDVADLELGTNWIYQQFVLDALNQVYHLLTRLKKVNAPDGDIEICIWTDDGADAPDERLSSILTITGASLGTVYADLVGHFSDVNAIGYALIDGGTYWLAQRRTLGSGGQVYLAISTNRVYGRGSFQKNTGGPVGPTPGSTRADDASVGTVTWGTPANTGASDDAYATALLDAVGEISHYVKHTQLGFSVPSGATIDGIEVAVERSTDDGSGDNYIADHSVRLVQAGTITGDDKAGVTNNDAAAKWGTTDETAKYGGPDDLWALTWTPADINNVNFGCVVSAKQVQAPAGSPNARIDYITITVFYTESTLPGQQSSRFAVLGRPQSTIQSEAPSGSNHEITLDDIEITFDNTAPRTPDIFIAPQQTSYWLKGTLKNDDTGQELALSLMLQGNNVLTIDCLNHTVTRGDTGEAVPGAITPSDLEEWMRLDAGTVNLRYTETGIGTVEVTTKHRDSWA